MDPQQTVKELQAIYDRLIRLALSTEVKDARVIFDIGHITGLISRIVADIERGERLKRASANQP